VDTLENRLRSRDRFLSCPDFRKPTLSVISDDPLFNARAAAAIRALTCDTLKKWRQHSQGPDFIYGEDGRIRYSLSALRRFIAHNTVKTGQNRY
jgi:hypothetical protein